MTKTCPRCGAVMKSVSIGWECPVCQVFEDMLGDIHLRKEEPFVPTQTFGDRLRSMSDEEIAFWVSGNCVECCCEDICGGCKARATKTKSADEVCYEIVLERLMAPFKEV